MTTNRQSVQIAAPMLSFLGFVAGGIGKTVDFIDLDTTTLVLLGAFAFLGMVFFALPTLSTTWETSEKQRVREMKEFFSIWRSIIMIAIVFGTLFLLLTDIGVQNFPKHVNEYIVGTSRASAKTPHKYSIIFVKEKQQASVARANTIEELLEEQPPKIFAVNFAKSRQAGAEIIPLIEEWALSTDVTSLQAREIINVLHEYSKDQILLWVHVFGGVLACLTAIFLFVMWISERIVDFQVYVDESDDQGEAT